MNTPLASPPNDPSVEIPVTVIDESANPILVASIVPIVAVPDTVKSSDVIVPSKYASLNSLELDPNYNKIFRSEKGFRN